jgi:hypothetical protein
MIMEWAIIDDNGIIHSGKDHEMDSAWDVLTCHGDVTDYIVMKVSEDPELGLPENREALMDIYFKWHVVHWTGDIKLIQIHKVHR